MQATTRAVLGGAATVVGVVGVLVAALTACQQGAGATTPRATATARPVPVAASCGAIQLGQGEEVPDEAWTCLDAALASGRATTLVVTRPTVEGDPVVLTYRVGGDVRGLEVVTDDSADAFAAPQARGVHVERCPGTVRVVEPRDCRTVDPG